MYVRLQHDWTDSDGVVHAAGETVEVDLSTLAQLESSGVVSEPATETHAHADSGDGDGDHAADDGGDHAGDEDGAGGGDDGAGDVHCWVGPTGDPNT